MVNAALPASRRENGPAVGSAEPFVRARCYIVGISTESMR
ncbi:hypothetical protein SAMN05443544_2100 [Agromyces cerinus subsp. cerinus]|uniref:Uncharacterized protein n=1 Tax=Agromyces cerinus subsp. cerinus TaxID=232089 RepID=A0A1N6FJU2_9MICO|nr:hypothetical protein SAMN05443544_2100 [Agromyces cerinus subsp. cerinus]